ncbi:hypothetical protein Y1Q_0007077 [Alligator mississippiensis]|uniref:Uncharacterized protein n=1 Tax=Alligator mississippiensis TaxID=8496 RepID=A0A151N5J7_ALLMI|nr:hypothetical protein Y1Q_0007077 [Alligator mississippiensis]
MKFPRKTFSALKEPQRQKKEGNGQEDKVKLFWSLVAALWPHVIPPSRSDVTSNDSSDMKLNAQGTGCNYNPSQAMGTPVCKEIYFVCWRGRKGSLG